MNPMLMARALMQGGQMPMQGGPGNGLPGVSGPGQPGGSLPDPLTLDKLNQMKLQGQSLPSNWINQISPQERASIMPQWSNG